MDNLPDRLILFDGVCNLCNGAVQYVIKHDKKNLFRFASLQSATGQKITRQFQIKDADTFILIQDNKAYTMSTAALKVAQQLDGGIRLLYGFIIVPKFIRDGIYNWIAGNRYKWFGVRQECMIPTPDVKARFLN